jgi:hypothetical protein
MTSQSPRIYIYKITFEEVPYYYYGIHKERKYNEYYMGSPITHKWVWDFYTPKKQILEIFEFSDGGWLKAQKVEERVIKPFYNDDKWCLNEKCGLKYSLQTSRKNGNRAKNLKTGIFAICREEHSKNSIKAGKISGLKHKENKTGIFGRSEEKIKQDAKKGTERARQLGVGIYGLTKEQRMENAKKYSSMGGKIGGKLGAKNTNSQKWECLETGFITNPGNLTKYQKAKGIDTSKRKRIA